MSSQELFRSTDVPNIRFLNVFSTMNCDTVCNLKYFGSSYEPTARNLYKLINRYFVNGVFILRFSTFFIIIINILLTRIHIKTSVLIFLYISRCEYNRISQHNYVPITNRWTEREFKVF